MAYENLLSPELFDAFKKCLLKAKLEGRTYIDNNEFAELLASRGIIKSATFEAYKEVYDHFLMTLRRHGIVDNTLYGWILTQVGHEVIGMSVEEQTEWISQLKQKDETAVNDLLESLSYFDKD